MSLLMFRLIPSLLLFMVSPHLCIFLNRAEKEHNPNCETKGQSCTLPGWEMLNRASGFWCDFGFPESLQDPLLGITVEHISRESWKTQSSPRWEPQLWTRPRTSGWNMVRAVGCAGSLLLLLFKTFLFYIGVYLIHSVMIDSGAQQSDSATHTCVPILPPAPLPSRLPHSSVCSLLLSSLPSSLGSRSRWDPSSAGVEGWTAASLYSVKTRQVPQIPTGAGSPRHSELRV